MTEPLPRRLVMTSLMTGLTVVTWIRFFVWLGIGLVIYFGFSQRHSEFAQVAQTEDVVRR